MIVKQLVEELQKMPQNIEVAFEDEESSQLVVQVELIYNYKKITHFEGDVVLLS